VLFGTEYWGGLYDWLQRTVHAGGKVSERDMELLHLTDDINDAVSVVENAYLAWQDAH
jgi:hypothetical protein